MTRRAFPEVPGVRHRFVDVDGARLHVAEAGHGEPVVLLHGFPQHWYAWHLLIPRLAERYRLICPDWAGYGWSDTPRQGYGTIDRVRCLLHLVDSFGLDRVRVIGHETGGWIALVAGLDHPDRISQLVALNIAPPWTSRRRFLGHAWRYWYTGIVEQPFFGRTALRRYPTLVRLLLGHYASPGAWDEATLNEFAAALAVPGCARAAEIQHRRFVFQDMCQVLRGRFQRRQLTVPTLLLTGERDFFFPPRLLRGVENCARELSVRTVSGAGHYLAQERPDLVARAVTDFFAPATATWRPVSRLTG